MYSMVMTAIVRGLSGVCIQVEADVSNGMPMFEMVGFLSSEVKEARERVRIALQSNGYRLPAKRITVSLSPADIKKSGAGFDLPIAVAVLAALGEVESAYLKDTLVFGEISLNGRIQPVRGVLPIVAKAKEMGMKRCLIPEGNRMEAAQISGIEIWAAEDLKELVSYLKGKPCRQKPLFVSGDAKTENTEWDFSEINGQESVKRACEVAAVSYTHLTLPTICSV